MFELARGYAPDAEHIRQLTLPGDPLPQADAVVSVGRALSYLSDEQAIDRALVAIARALRLGGLLFCGQRPTAAASQGLGSALPCGPPTPPGGCPSSVRAGPGLDGEGPGEVFDVVAPCAVSPRWNRLIRSAMDELMPPTLVGQLPGTVRFGDIAVEIMEVHGHIGANPEGDPCNVPVSNPGRLRRTITA